MNERTSTNKPEDHVRIGPLQAAIWKNVNDEGYARYGVTFERRYRDAEGNWQSTASYSRDDLLLLAKLSDLCHTRICEIQSAERARSSEGNDQTAAAPVVRRKATAVRGR